MSALEALRALEADIAAASARQQQLRHAKEAAVRAVNERREALVTALESDLDGSAEATAAQKALEKAQKEADQPWDAKIEAAGRLVQQARTKRGVYLGANVDRLLQELAAPAVDWPERARTALEALYAVAEEYDHLSMPIERLAQEAGRPLRAPVNPLPVHDLRRMMRTTELHPPIPVEVLRADSQDDPDRDAREAADARLVADNKRRAA